MATEGFNVTAYAHAAAARMMASVGSNRTDWREVIERGMAAAYSQKDAEGLVQMVQLVVNLLDGEGRFEDAIGEIEHALAFARSDPNASVVLHGIKSSMLAAQGRLDAASEAISDGRAVAAAADEGPRTRFEVFEAAVGWQMLGPIGTDIPGLLDRCARLGLARDRSFLLSWYIPHLATKGDRRTAHPWIRHIRIEAEAAESRWRLSDAAAFEAWDDFLSEPEDQHGAASVERMNAMSVWRAEAIRLRDAVLRRDSEAAETAMHSLVGARRRLGNAAVGQVDQFAAAANGVANGMESITGAPPPLIHLNNLGATLAEAEAVALRGSQRAAGEWSDALASALPDSVESSMEWPLSVARIRGLLALRAGDARAARNGLQRALDWSRAVGFGTEEALSRLQLGELCAAADLRVPERIWKADRRQGAEGLESRGYDPVAQAYAVAHGLTLSSRNRLAERLTPREVDVLGQLADGRTYREAAGILGLAQPTVQTLAHRVYQKLGVSGKSAAVAEAKRLGVL